MKFSTVLSRRILASFPSLYFQGAKKSDSELFSIERNVRVDNSFLYFV